MLNEKKTPKGKDGKRRKENKKKTDMLHVNSWKLLQSVGVETLNSDV